MRPQAFKHITVRLPVGLANWLRIEAATRDISRSHLIRALLEKAAIAEQLDKEV